MTAGHRLAALLLVLTAASLGCKKHLEPEPPCPLPTPPALVTKAERQAAMRSVHYHAYLARTDIRKPRPRKVRGLVSLDQAVSILMRDTSRDAHRWRQRAVVTLAASSIRKHRPALLALGAPVPQLQMLMRRTPRYDWAVYVLRHNVIWLYPWWIIFHDRPIGLVTETPTPTATPTLTKTPTPTKTWTPQPPVSALTVTPTPTVTITPTTIMAAGPCTTWDLRGVPILCRSKGNPYAACEPPKAGTNGTWVQAEFVFSVNRPPPYVARILDPQNWDTCNPEFFLHAYVLPPPSSSYPQRCSDVTAPPTPGAGYNYGEVWDDILYEHFDALGAASFKNRIKIDGTLSNATDYRYAYDLDKAVCSEYGLSEENGGLDVDEGFVEVTGNTDTSVVRAMKKLSFTDRVAPYGITGNEIDEDIFSVGSLDTMGAELADTVCTCQVK